MQILSEINILIKKEILLEWRQKYALNGLLLYVIGAVMIAYLSFNLQQNSLNPITWNALFWIIMLFSAVNAVGKSFVQERPSRFLYYYVVANPLAIIISKIIYNTSLMLVMAFLGLIAYWILLGNPVIDKMLFSFNLFLGALGFATTLTMVAGIAAKANQNATLMAILSFPVIVPMLLLLIKVSKNALDGLDRSVSFDAMLTLLAMNVIVVAISLILFPFLWKS